jgi:Flp pilus assembly protein TadG
MRQRQEGQALVEIALVLPLVLILFMAVLDFGQAVVAYNTVANGSRGGMRAAIVDQNTTVIRAAALRQMTALNGDAASVLYVPCADPKIGCPASVTVTYPWRPITPIIGGLIGPITLSSTTSMPMERVYSTP